MNYSYCLLKAYDDSTESVEGVIEPGLFEEVGTVNRMGDFMEESDVRATFSNWYLLDLPNLF